MERSIERWEWRDGARIKVDPDAIGNLLVALGREAGRPHDAIDAEDLVRAARDPESPAHAAFDWNDATAAHGHRLETARLIIRSCRPIYVIERQPTKVLGWINVKLESGESAYVMMDKVARDEALNEQAIRSARAGLEGWRDRYKQIVGFDKVLRMADAMIEEIKRIEEKKAPAKVVRKKKAGRVPAQT